MNSGEVSEIKRHLGVVVEGLQSQIKQVAEGVLGIRQEMSAFREEVRAEFEETRAMIRLSYSELDRRIHVLEDNFASLEARVQRIEGH